MVKLINYYELFSLLATVDLFSLLQVVNI